MENTNNKLLNIQYEEILKKVLEKNGLSNKIPIDNTTCNNVDDFKKALEALAKKAKFDSQSRKYLITINNPSAVGFSHELIEEKLEDMGAKYYCIADEIGAKTGTYHTHIFVCFTNARKFSTMSNKFPIANIARARGTIQQNRDYVAKEGKWIGTEKESTKVPGTFVESGPPPTEGALYNPENAQLIEDVKDGHTIMELVKTNPKLALRTKNIEHLIEANTREQYLNEKRSVELNYIHTEDSAQALEYISSRYPLKDICRITNYGNNNKLMSYDVYHGEKVIVYDDFCGQISPKEFKRIIDGYPMYLPARYGDRIACYDVVYVISAETPNTFFKGKIGEKILIKINEYVDMVDFDGEVTTNG